MDDYALINISFAVLALISCFTLPSLWRLGKTIRRRPKPANESKLYEDQDGVATEESMSQYSTRWHFTFISVLLFAALATSFALAVFATVQWSPHHSRQYLAQLWGLFTSWVSTLSLITSFTHHRRPCCRFKSLTRFESRNVF